MFRIVNRPRLDTFEKIVGVENADKKKSKLHEDVYYFKNLFLGITDKSKKEFKSYSSNLNGENNIYCSDGDFNFNFVFTDEEQKPSPRSRFFSA